MANDKTFPEVKTNPLTEAAKKRLSRSMMFVPGNTPKMINSADIHGADSIMIDIEDSVAVTEKDTARLLTAEALKSRKFRGETVFVSTILHKLLMVMMILMLSFQLNLI